MARFHADEAKNYGGQGGGGFFSIADDKEVKQVRFMYNTVDDIEGLSVHKVEIDGKDRYVNCLREYNDPVDACPFCREKMAVQARLFIPVYNIDEEAVQLWDRGKSMFGKMTTICSRYATDRNIVNNIFDIERNGKPKDQKTTYEIFYVDHDNTEIEDLGEVPQVLGTLVLDKTVDDMEYFLEEGEFPPTEDDEPEEEAPVRRRESRPARSNAKTEAPARGRSNNTGSTRRTPSNSGSRRRAEDEY